MTSEGTGSQYIPKFIQNVPWYYKLNNKNTSSSDSTESIQDAFLHQRKEVLNNLNSNKKSDANDGVIQSLDDYDAKRDHWQGTADEEWDNIVSGWNETKTKSNLDKSMMEDSDDTDYELELEELGLHQKHLKSNHLEDPMERANRDRLDVPAYIIGITANEGGKIRYGEDSLAAIVHEDSAFVRQSKDENELKQIQTFAWEKNIQHEKEQQLKLYRSELSGELDVTVTQANLDYVVEASPTLLMMKAKEKEKKAKDESQKKLKKLMDRYGG